MHKPISVKLLLFIEGRISVSKNTSSISLVVRIVIFASHVYTTKLKAEADQPSESNSENNEKDRGHLQTTNQEIQRAENGKRCRKQYDGPRQDLPEKIVHYELCIEPFEDPFSETHGADSKLGLLLTTLNRVPDFDREPPTPIPGARHMASPFRTLAEKYIVFQCSVKSALDTVPAYADLFFRRSERFAQGVATLGGDMI